MESIQRIMVGAEVFGQILPANRSLEHPAHWGSIFGDPIHCDRDPGPPAASFYDHQHPR
jgi:hypothetical protein